MPELATQPPGGDRRADQNKPGRPKREDSIRTAVLKALGMPAGLFKVDVRPLWEGRFRVNVWIGPDVHSARVVHTYFVSANDRGDILSATPRIKSEYK